MIAAGRSVPKVALSPTRRTGEGGPIRVAFCLDTFHIGGTELNAVRTALRLDKSRFSVSFFHGQAGPLMEEVSAAGIPCYSFPLEGLLSTSALVQGIRMAKAFRRIGIEIVHAHDVYSNIFAGMIGRLAGVRRVIVSRRWGVSQYGPGLSRLNRTAYRFADQVLVNSQQIAASVSSDEGVAPSRVTVVNNFADREAFLRVSDDVKAELRRQLGVPVDAMLIGMVASLKPVKNPEMLVSAFAQVAERDPSVHLVFIGDGVSRGDLERTVAERGMIDRVTITGTLPNAGRLHSCLDISVLCSRSEGFPNSVVEAMAAAVPVIATRVGAIPDAVSHMTTGLLVPSESPTELEEALRRLIGDPSLRTRLGRAGYEIALDRFHEDTVIASLESLYERLVESR